MSNPRPRVFVSYSHKDDGLLPALLAQLVGAERALFVFDGLEPLQSAHAFDRGTRRDPLPDLSGSRA